MSSIHDVYWDFLYKIMGYSVDSSSPNAPLHLAEKPIACIDERVFLETLYAPRSNEHFEERLIKYLLEAMPVICIAAGRGCGKTSAIRFAVNKIRASHPNTKIVMLDIKRVFDQRRFQDLNEANAARRFSEFLRAEIQGRLFPRPRDERDLLAWLLAGSPDEGIDDFDYSLVSDLHDVFVPVIAEALGESGTRQQRFTSLSEWFFANQSRYAAISRETLPLLRTAHVVQAGVRLRNWERIILIYDNVDRIPANFQPRFLEVANDSQIAMGGHCTTAIALRKENIRRPDPRSGDGGDLIYVILPNDEEYPCLLMPKVGPEHVNNVLERRYAYSVELCGGHLAPELLEQLDSLIKPLHLGVVSEFLSNSINALANESMRNIVALYIGFVQYLQTLQHRGVLDFSGLLSGEREDERHLKTVFFLWLREQGSKYGVVLYDILKGKELESDAADFASMASEHHLLMTCVLNLTEELTRSSYATYPPFSTVYRRMEELGFSLDAVKTALREMCAPPGEQPRVIEFFRCECNVDDLTEKSEVPLCLTILGNELIKEVFSTVGYVWGQAYREYPKTIRNRSYHTLNRAERIEVFYLYMRKMSMRHLRLLGVLRDESVQANWLQRYRRRFGVGERLQVERILESGAAFYGPTFGKIPNAIELLREAYLVLQAQLVGGAKFEELDLSELDKGFEHVKGLKKKH